MDDKKKREVLESVGRYRLLVLIKRLMKVMCESCKRESFRMTYKTMKGDGVVGDIGELDRYCDVCRPKMERLLQKTLDGRKG